MTSTTDLPPPRYRRVRRRLTLALALSALPAALWLAGLFVFAAAVPRGASEAAVSMETDAIVVLTGGTMRLERGLDLLTERRAQKLFISGVNERVDLQQLMRQMPQSAEALSCCIVLGHHADHTTGNAQETAAWMESQGYRSLRLVTSSYHMPRSLAEFRAAMPAIRIVPEPVSPEHVKLEEWWRWPGTAKLIVSEYNKYLVVQARRTVIGLYRRVAGA